MSKKRSARKTPIAEPQRGPRIWPYALGLLVTLYAAFQAYAPALHGPFVFDDLLMPYVALQGPDVPIRAWLGVRPLLMVTYWLNLRLWGRETFSFHVVNVLLHVASSVLLFLVFRKILELARVKKPQREILASFGAAVFLLHPIQTEAVSYVAHRAESLSAGFFFAALLAFLYRRSAAVSWTDTLLILVLFAAAISCKEHTIVLPAVLLLTDYYWNPGFSFQGIRRNWRIYATTAALGAAGTVFIASYLRNDVSIGFKVADFTWYQYVFTQWRVLLVYFRLFLFPAGQNMDYDFPVSRTVLEHGSIAALAVILLIVGAAIHYRRRYPLASYGFFVSLAIFAPTSSFIPINDVITERRLYLPIFGLLLIALEFLRRLNLNRQVLIAGLTGICLAAVVTTYRRNAYWGDSVKLHEDTARKSPGKWRAQYNLGHTYFQQGRCPEAVRQLELAARLRQPDHRHLVIWGLAYQCVKQPEQALQRLREAAAITPTATVYSYIGWVLGQQGKSAEALASLEIAQKLDPNYSMTYVHRGSVHLALKQYEDAAAEFQRALQYDPNNRQALDRLALVQQLRSTRR